MELDRLFPYRNGATRRIDRAREERPGRRSPTGAPRRLPGGDGSYMLVGTFPSTPFT